MWFIFVLHPLQPEWEGDFITFFFLCSFPRRTVHDKMTATDIRLSDEQVDLVHRLQQGKFGDVNFNEYEVPPNTIPPL